MVHEVFHVIGNNNLKTGKDTKGVYEVCKFGIVPELRQILFLYKTDQISLHAYSCETCKKRSCFRQVPLSKPDNEVGKKTGYESHYGDFMAKTSDGTRINIASQF